MAPRPDTTWVLKTCSVVFDRSMAGSPHRCGLRMTGPLAHLRLGVEPELLPRVGVAEAAHRRVQLDPVKPHDGPAKEKTWSEVRVTGNDREADAGNHSCVSIYQFMSVYLSISIYIYPIYIYTYTYIYLYLSLSLSIYLSIYLYLPSY